MSNKAKHTEFVLIHTYEVYTAELIPFSRAISFSSHHDLTKASTCTVQDVAMSLQ